ncbi:MAG: hypothetical protein PHS53_01245 [Candidatus Pacebacteria bacterium]|nr:hypothetical protein [Candidatus Paceibacterota bacterium]MDD5356758.1 hypothetical protein [Candidatus Paceibacterota bacterium]
MTKAENSWEGAPQQSKTKTVQSEEPHLVDATVYSKTPEDVEREKFEGISSSTFNDDAGQKILAHGKAEGGKDIINEPYLKERIPKVVLRPEASVEAKIEHWRGIVIDQERVLKGLVQQGRILGEKDLVLAAIHTLSDLVEKLKNTPPQDLAQREREIAESARHIDSALER